MPDDFGRRLALRTTAFALAVAGLVVIWNARYVLLLLFAGIVGALLFSIPARWVHMRLHVPRGPALLIVLLAAAAFITGLAALRGPALWGQFNALQIDLPVAAHQIMARVNSASAGRWLMMRISDSFQSPDSFSYAIAGIRGVMSAASLTLAACILVLFTSLFLAAEPDFYLRGLRRLTPRAARLCFSDVSTAQPPA